MLPYSVGHPASCSIPPKPVIPLRWDKRDGRVVEVGRIMPFCSFSLLQVLSVMYMSVMAMVTGPHHFCVLTLGLCSCCVVCAGRASVHDLT